MVRFFRNKRGGFGKELDITNIPCCTVLSDTVGNLFVQYDNKTKQNKITDMNKPEYKVPSMAEIKATEPNGYKVVSTFSGCGGSCTGYRMAGFKVIWANEFIPAASETYKTNYPDSYLDTRDIRNIKPDDILQQTGLKQGELDLFDGSPPCASFSTAGKRESGWGKVKKYSDTQQRTDDLFFEYSRILKGLMPKVFVAENVSGLLKGTAKGYFIEIMKELKSCGYNVKCKLLDAQWLGVPQMRQRAIFIGVRNDLNMEPVYPKPLPYRYSVRDAIDYIQKIKIGGKPNNFVDSNRPSGTIVQSDAITSPTAYLSCGGFVEVDISKYAIGKEYDKLKQGEKSEKYLNLCKAHTEKPSPCITQTGGNISAACVVHPTEKRKFTIPELKRICAFPDDFVLTGTYAQQWERLGRAVPPVMMFHISKTIQTAILDKL